MILNKNSTVYCTIDNEFPVAFNSLVKNTAYYLNSTYEIKKNEEFSFIINYNNTEDFINDYISKLKNQFSTLLSEEEFDITTKDYIANIVIKIPETILTDGITDIEYPLKGLYLKIEIDMQLNRLNGIKLYKTIWNQFEIKTNYRHSHSNSAGSLCLGKNTDIEKNVDSAYKFIKFNTIANMILNFMSYFEHESWEGTPYQYISDILTTSIDFKFDFENFLISKYFTDYKLVGTNIKFDDANIKKYISNTSNKIYGVVSREGVSNIFTVSEFNSITNNVVVNQNNNIIFKGQTIKNEYVPLTYDEYLSIVKPKYIDAVKSKINLSEALNDLTVYHNNLKEKLNERFFKKRSRAKLEALINN